MTPVLIINGVDFSDCITMQEGIDETPAYKDGPNTGTSKVGTPIFDRVNTLYNWKHKCKPLTRARYEALAAACQPNVVTVTFNTFRSASPMTAKAQLKLSGIEYATSWGPLEIYHGATISAELAE